MPIEITKLLRVMKKKLLAYIPLWLQASSKTKEKEKNLLN